LGIPAGDARGDDGPRRQATPVAPIALPRRRAGRHEGPQRSFRLNILNLLREIGAEDKHGAA